MTEKDKDITGKEQKEDVQEQSAAKTNEPHAEAAVEPDHLVGEEPANDALVKLEEELSEMKDKYLRLYSEFDNYRKRTAKERADLLKTANQDMMLALLPVLDDLERAKQSIETSTDVEALKQGVDLVFSKLMNTLQQKGLSPMDASGETFDSDLHEAVTQIPAPDENMKGKVVDVIEKGYFLNEKVIRFAKVVVGA